LLYIEVDVNGHKVKALVDSGAQTTIMSPDCAEACGIMRLVDKRYSGVAHGVGTATIIGRVHAAHVRIGTLHLSCSFTVMEGKSVDMLLGLDMLKRHQARIDLAKDMLIIQGEEFPFLSEADLPRGLEEAVNEEPTLPGPSGTVIGQRTGAIVPADQVHRPTSIHSPQSTAQTQPTTGTAPAAATAGSSSQSTDPIEQLMAMGASRETATNALLAAQGDLEVAAGLLFFN
jgi:DNA damage-inducible protein 1